MQEIIDEIKNNLKKTEDFKDLYPKFSNPLYTPKKIDRSNFKDIKTIDSKKKVAFIDGGNAEIIRTDNLSLNLIRVAYVIFKENKKIESKKQEFFCLITSFDENDEIFYKTKIFNSDLIDDLKISSVDKTLKVGNNRIDISRIVGVVRRFSELSLGKSILEKSEIIVLDGSLECSTTGEDIYMNDLLEEAKKEDKIISGFCKSSSLMTDKGNLISETLQNISEDKIWYYEDLVKNENPLHKGEILFTRLHKDSGYAFRFEISDKRDVQETLSILSDNSKDPIFLGYPYGLILADNLARISNKEKEYYKTIFSSKLDLNLKDAHKILDSISF